MKKDNSEFKDSPPAEWDLTQILNEAYGITNAAGSILAWKIIGVRSRHSEFLIAVYQISG